MQDCGRHVQEDQPKKSCSDLIYMYTSAALPAEDVYRCVCVSRLYTLLKSKMIICHFRRPFNRRLIPVRLRIQALQSAQFEEDFVGFVWLRALVLTLA